MSLHHFFLEEQVLVRETSEVFQLRLARDDVKHAQVLRLEVGEHIAVVDAARDYFECEIVSFERGELFVRIARREEGELAEPTVILVQGMAKGDKMETVIRHATEVGVAAFVPLKCARSILKLEPKKVASRVERWQSIAKSAAMQSGRRFVPEVSEPQTLAQACGALSDVTAVLVCWEEAPLSCGMREAIAESLAQAGTLPVDARIAVVVGPEGGLAEDEVDRILACNPRARLVSLGASILRTETAGIVAPALALHELGGLGNVSRGNRANMGEGA